MDVSRRVSDRGARERESRRCPTLAAHSRTGAVVLRPLKDGGGDLVGVVLSPRRGLHRVRGEPHLLEVCSTGRNQSETQGNTSVGTQPSALRKSCRHVKQRRHGRGACWMAAQEGHKFAHFAATAPVKTREPKFAASRLRNEAMPISRGDGRAHTRQWDSSKLFGSSWPRGREGEGRRASRELRTRRRWRSW